MYIMWCSNCSLTNRENVPERLSILSSFSSIFGKGVGTPKLPKILSKNVPKIHLEKVIRKEVHQHLPALFGRY